VYPKIEKYPEKGVYIERSGAIFLQIPHPYGEKLRNLCSDSNRRAKNTNI